MNLFKAVYNYGLKNSVVVAFGVIGLSWYYVSLFALGSGWPFAPKSNELREFMSLSVTTISVSLATFVGMLLGYTRVSDEAQREAKDTVDVDRKSRLVRFAEDNSGTILQWISVILYAASLVLAIFFWQTESNDKKTDPAIVNLGKSLLGVIGGSLAVILNLPKR